jgi:tetratricopeptide (TPR) repeat protein
MQKLGGLINYFHLDEWYILLSDEQQRKIKSYYGGNPNEIDKGRSISSATASGFLSIIGFNAVSKKDFQIAYLVLDKSLELSKDVLDKHYALLSLIDMTYKSRDVDTHAIENCIKYCLIDIEISDQVIQSWKEENVVISLHPKDEELEAWLDGLGKHLSQKEIYISLGYPIAEMAKHNTSKPPYIPSFTRLAIIYENQERINEAIEICKKANSLGLKDSNNIDDFSKRINRLEAKLRK